VVSKGRKPGDWVGVAASRAKVEKVIRAGRGLTNIPNIGEAGSAAYRRLLASRRDQRREG